MIDINYSEQDYKNNLADLVRYKDMLKTNLYTLEEVVLNNQDRLAALLKMANTKEELSEEECNRLIDMAKEGLKDKDINYLYGELLSEIVVLSDDLIETLDMMKL